MRITRKPTSRRDAVAAVEFAVTLPLLLLLLVGIWEVERIVQVKQIVSNAAREGARAASTGTNDYDEIRTLVLNYLTNSGINNTGVAVEVKNITKDSSGTTYDPSAATQLDRLEVTVSLPFDNVRWAMIDQITDVRSIVAVSYWDSAKDVPISVDLSGKDIPAKILK